MRNLPIAAFAVMFGVLAADRANADTVTLFPRLTRISAVARRRTRTRGPETSLRIQSNAINRAVVHFDQAAIQSAIGTGTLQSASLQLFVEVSGSWGSGRSVDLYRLTSDWTEAGVTWNCPIDSSPTNGAADCASQWDGGNLAASPTASVLHTNALAGNFIDFDVTADVAAFLASTPNDGWIIKKTNETQDRQRALHLAGRRGRPETAARVVVHRRPAAAGPVQHRGTRQSLRTRRWRQVLRLPDGVADQPERAAGLPRRAETEAHLLQGRPCL